MVHVGPAVLEGHGRAERGAAADRINVSDDGTSVSVDDDVGHSRALRFRESDQLFFPITMISKRAKFGDPIDVRALFDKTAKHVAALERRSN